MAKTSELLKNKAKARRARLSAANKGLKLTKNWYPTSDDKQKFSRRVKQVRTPRLRKDIQPGQVLILLSGRFRGRRVVFVKSLESGLLLVTGPYKFNGVPLKRVNQAYVIATKTRVNLSKIPGLELINDTFFARVNVNRGNNFFEEPKTKRERVSESRRNAQNTVDTEVAKAVRTVPQLKEYLQNRFALKNGDKPHLMSF
jgi:large subunit ribosomal protein L6e